MFVTVPLSNDCTTFSVSTAVIFIAYPVISPFRSSYTGGFQEINTEVWLRGTASIFMGAPVGPATYSNQITL